jgi:hypothetical protein
MESNQTTRTANELKNQAYGWRRLRWWGVIQLTQLAPARLRWHWDHEALHGKRQSYLVDPRGRRWRVKLARGAWITPDPK